MRRLVLLTLSILLWNALAWASTYEFTTVATSTGMFSTGFGFLASLNNSGEVAFFSYGPNGTTNVFEGDGTKVMPIATGLMDTGAPAINDRGMVAFRHVLTDGSQRISLWDNGTTTPVVGTNSFFTGFGPHADLNNSGIVAFGALTAGGPGVFVATPGNVTPIATAGGGTTPTTCCPAVNNHGTVAFLADVGSGGAVFVGDGTSLTQVPNTASSFKARFDPDINDAGEVAFFAIRNDNSSGIFKADPTGLHTIVDSSGPLFPVPGFVALNNAGRVAFLAGSPTGGSLFVGPDPTADRVVGAGDELLGGMIREVEFFRDGFNDLGQVAFFAELSNGTTGIFLATPVPEPSTWLLLASGLVGLILWRKRTA